MADTISVVVKLNDQISSTLKSITNTTQGCSKAMEELAKKGQNLEARYRELNKRSAETETADALKASLAA